MEQDPSSFQKLAGVVDALKMDQNVVIERASVFESEQCWSCSLSTLDI
jgi:hypothetical protein